MTVHESDWVWITLNPEHIAFSDEKGEARFDNAEVFDFAPHNNAPTDPVTSLWFNVMGVRGECAGYLYLKPVKWNAYKPGRAALRLADLEDWIDAKTRHKAWHDLIVQKNDRPDWAYLHVLAHDHPRYCLVGWCYGREAKHDRFLKDPAGGREAYFVPQDSPILRPVADLLTEVRRRQHRTDAERAGYPKGFVGYSREGHFIHYCQCGAWASNSEGTALLKDRPGNWWCPKCYKEKQHESQSKDGEDRRHFEVGTGPSAP